MKLIKKHLALLGFKVEDKISGFKGVISSVSFDLYGCVQVCIDPGLAKDGKLGTSYWFDVSRLKILSKKAIIKQPNFEEGKQAEGDQGCAVKPGK